MVSSSLIMVGLVVLVAFMALSVVIRFYKRVPSNKILVIYGKVGDGQKAKIIQGGGSFVIPFIQDYAWLSLDPLAIELDIRGALSNENIRVNIPATFMVGVSRTEQDVQNAAQRLLSLDTEQIKAVANDIILGQLRAVIATMKLEEINQNRDKFLKEIEEKVDSELRKVGLEIINVNIREVTDEAGYLVSLGKKAAAEASNKAKRETAEQEKLGEIGVAQNNREKEITVAQQTAEAASGKAQADANQRTQVAKFDSDAVQGENEAKAKVADSEATLAVKQAEATRKGEVAKAEAETAVLRALKEQEVAKLEKETLAEQEVAKKRIEVEAHGLAEQVRIKANAEADAILAKAKAEAEGIRQILNAKAEGYEKLMKAAQGQTTALLMLEKLPELVGKQVEAIKGIKIDKITVVDSPNGNGEGGVPHLVRGLVNALPGLHEFAKNTGLELPAVLGSMVPDVTKKAPKDPNDSNGKVS